MDDHLSTVPPLATERYRLWSLWDMLGFFQAGEFADSMANLGKMIATLNLHRAFHDFDVDDQRYRILAQLRSIRSRLGGIPLSPVVSGQWDRCERDLERMTIEGIPTCVALLRELQENLLTELKQPRYLMIPADKAELLTQADALGDSVAVAFPMAVTDVNEAARCMALELYTASVFHLMRVLEHGLRWAANDMGRPMSPEVDEQWKTLIDWMLAEIGKLEGKPNTPEKAEWLRFYSGVALDLRNFKNAWRNDVSHSRVTYGESEASRVWLHVKGFMQALATRIET